MDRIKLLHCADLHFDTPFTGSCGVQSELRKEDIRETFGNIIKLAIEEQVQILLISGDLFDNLSIMKTTLNYIIKKLMEINNIQVFISPGNHDPVFQKSYYNMVEWPSNVHIFKDGYEKVILQEYNTVVYGKGFSRTHEKESLLSTFKIENEKMINIMVLHGEVCKSGQESLYNPITEEQINQSGLDYIALGHRHSFSGIKISGKTHWAYSGNPEGRGFDEIGAKGVIIGEVGTGYANLKFKEICKRKYIEESIDITGSTTYEDIILIIEEKLGVYNTNEDIEEKLNAMKINLYRILLKGEIKSDILFNTAVIESKLLDKFYYINVINSTTFAIDYDSINNEFSIRGIYVRKLMERLKKTEDIKEKIILEQALKLGLMSLEQKELAFDED